jgi:hypothetical protein
MMVISKTVRGNYINWHVEQGVTDGTEALRLAPMRLMVPAPSGSMRTPAGPINRLVASAMKYRERTKAIGPRLPSNL